MDDRCPDCGAIRFFGDWPWCPHGSSTMKSGGGLFPYTTCHISGTPIQVESLHHVRQLEKRYGVVLPAFSKDNVRDVDPIKNPPRYRFTEDG